MTTILVVIDDHDRSCLMSTALDDAGYSVITAADGVMTLRLLRAALHPYVVLLDVHLPFAVLTVLAYERFLMPQHAYVLCTQRPLWFYVGRFPQLEQLNVQPLQMPFDTSELLGTVALMSSQLVPLGAQLIH